MSLRLMVSLVLLTVLTFSCGDDSEPSNNTSTNNTSTNNTSTNNTSTNNTSTNNTSANNTSTNNTSTNNTSTNNGEELTWVDGMDNFLKARCSRCHTWILTYEQTTTDLVSLRDKVEERHGNLTVADRDIILQWIDAGAPRE